MPAHPDGSYDAGNDPALRIDNYSHRPKVFIGELTLMDGHGELTLMDNPSPHFCSCKRCSGQSGLASYLLLDGAEGSCIRFFKKKVHQPLAELFHRRSPVHNYLLQPNGHPDQNHHKCINTF